VAVVELVLEVHIVLQAAVVAAMVEPEPVPVIMREKVVVEPEDIVVRVVRVQKLWAVVADLAVAEVVVRDFVI
jgi:hypothetical protein